MEGMRAPLSLEARPDGRWMHAMMECYRMTPNIRKLHPSSNDCRSPESGGGSPGRQFEGDDVAIHGVGYENASLGGRHAESEDPVAWSTPESLPLIDAIEEDSADDNHDRCEGRDGHDQPEWAQDLTDHEDRHDGEHGGQL